jgi:hypothetical protein
MQNIEFRLRENNRMYDQTAEKKFAPCKFQGTLHIYSLTNRIVKEMNYIWNCVRKSRLDAR